MVQQIGSRKGALMWLSLGASTFAFAILACNGGNGTSSLGSNASAPVISSVSPSAGATGVALGTNPSAVFSMAMAPLSGTTFTLSQGSTAIPGAVTTSSDGLTATFAPSASGRWRGR